MNENNLFQFIMDNLDKSFDLQEKKAISRSILCDIAEFNPPWSQLTQVAPDLFQKIEDAIFRINLGEPTQYVCGMAAFRKFVFSVNENVLIPRPESEELVSLVLDNLHLLPEGKGIDVGTGSGAIAISIAFESGIEMDALDLSAGALRVASENVKKYQAKVNLLQANILEVSNLEKYAFFVSNPPYIPMFEKKELMPSVYNYEPNIALFVPDESPLLFYEKIATLALNNLLPKGALFFECHYKYATEVAELLKSLSFEKVGIVKDVQGKERFVFGFLP